MKKKIFFFGFIICVFVTLFMLPTSAALPTMPDAENMCVACAASWEVVDHDHCNWSSCTCKLKECPTCGNNSVLVYCHSVHKYSFSFSSSEQVVGKSVTKNVNCQQCKKYFDVTATYYNNCSGTSSKFETVAPTCISRGYDVYGCAVHDDCKYAVAHNYSRKCNFKSALSYTHDYSYVTTFEADCANLGFDYYECSKCYLPMAKNIVPAGDHSPIGEVVHHAATCTQNGYDEFECSGCEQVIQVVTAEALGHNEVSSVIKEPSCFEMGEKNVSCSRCSYTNTESIPKTEHIYSSSVTKKATCNESGVLTYTCSVCSDSYTESIPKTTHYYVAEFGTNTDGSLSFRKDCINCSDSLPFDDACTNFTMSVYSCNCGMGYAETPWNGWEWTRSGATYTVYENACFDCDISIEITVWNDHSYINVVRDGQIYSVCENCEKETYVGVFDPDINGGDPECDHSYVSVFYPQNCVDHGYFMFICSKCGDGYIDRYVDPLGHIPKGTTVEPTCTEEGYTEYVCARSGCGETWVDNRTEPLGHNYINGFCTRCGKSDICVHTFLEHVVQPTCHDLGYTLYTCTQCGDSYMDNYVKRLEHKWKTMSKKSPTCDSYGYNELSCTLCGEAETERINPYGHKWVAKSASLREDNTADVTYRCSTCGAMKIENLMSAAAQAQNWLMTCMKGLFSGFADMYDIIANGVEIGGVTLGMVVTAVLVVLVLLLLIALAFKILG